MPENAIPAGTILVVEDSRTQAEYLGHILKKGGFSYILAENGKAALAMAAQEKPAIVLSDILMPEMDGYELCRTIRQNPDLADIPVIMVTQLFDPADVLKGLEAGADNFIIKPFDQETVFLRISEALHGRSRGENGQAAPVMEVVFSGHRYAIHASKLQILTILLSTYDLAIRKNADLHEAQERLLTMNEQLQQMVEELQVANEDLQLENTTRERVERDLAQANKKLQLMTSITRHDLVNQLTVLQGYLELADMLEKTDPEKAGEYLRKSIAVVQKTTGTIQFTSEYQKIGVASPVWHNVTACIDTAQRYATLGSIRLVNEIPAGAEIYADPLIEKVIFNLIDNAIRYASTLSTIRFWFRMEESSPIIVCEDDGVGVPYDTKERIFTYAYGTNTGMGLFLVREILSITDITISETGIPGKGARFEIRLPPEGYRVA
ncbi:MAG: hybrid sensor histidine kinase/response regulator [Methanomicrobiales archaeon HGW-Methanomicrobiales-3]|jgi:DNA-binding response OmpR family regulator|nr:MAG: hybrid sensor histidine kinase/response regulator [Methanomicrobiales archaeon HGW-Methanomicrobiales-3]